MKKASHWFTRAATRGHEAAQLALGRIYEQGIGVHHDPYRAAKYFRLAARQGNTEASYQLALLYARGQGVAQSTLNTHLLASIAAARTHSKAADLLKLLESGMDDSQLEHVRTQTARHMKTLSGTP
jgi:TPR repeat protein